MEETLKKLSKNILILASCFMAFGLSAAMTESPKESPKPLLTEVYNLVSSISARR